MTTKKIKRGAHTNVQNPERDIRDWIVLWNDNPRPYVWIKSAEQILASARKILRANQQLKSLGGWCETRGSSSVTRLM